MLILKKAIPKLVHTGLYVLEMPRGGVLLLSQEDVDSDPWPAIPFCSP